MNWNICKYLPTEASCQDYFNVVVGGHIHAMYKHCLEERRQLSPGNTPAKRRHMDSQIPVYASKLKLYRNQMRFRLLNYRVYTFKFSVF